MNEQRTNERTNERNVLINVWMNEEMEEGWKKQGKKEYRIERTDKWTNGEMNKQNSVLNCTITLRESTVHNYV